jgi:hypothetical protein
LPESRGHLGRVDVLTTLRRLNPDAYIIATDSTVQIGQLLFMFDRYGALRFVAHPSSRSARPL